MKQKQWHIAPRLAEGLQEHLIGLRLAELPVEPEAFLAPTIADLTPPESFWGMRVAVERIVQAIENKEPMVVWGDFDADGVTSTAILWETLHELGAEVMPYIPNRDAEGHGFSEEGLAQMRADNVRLIVTVDHGIAALDEIVAIKKMGMEVIVTDHHEPRRIDRGESVSGEDVIVLDEEGKSRNNVHDDRNSHSDAFALPDAVAVIHPLLSDNPQPMAGCGVAYVLAYAVWLQAKGRQDDEAARSEFAKDKIELAAIGTIADMVPLWGNNRIFAKYGLKALPETTRPGLQQLFKAAGLQDKKMLGTYEVGFSIGPRLNAPGRLADALESLRLLCTRDAARARRLAEDLNDLNKQRQDLLAVVAEEAKNEAIKHADGVYILAKPHWPAGVCGLAAGKIVEQYYRPAVVMEQMGELSRGSARSIKGFDITEALSKISDLLESYGGHAMAAGFVAKTERLGDIEQRLSELFWQQFNKETLRPVVNIDAALEPEEVNWQTYEMLQQFEPTGMGNPRPVFMLSGMQVVDYRAVGAEGKHVKLTLRSGGSNQDAEGSFEAIAFNFGFWVEELVKQPVVDVAFGLDKNEWNGRKSLQLMVKDIRLTHQ